MNKFLQVPEGGQKQRKIEIFSQELDEENIESEGDDTIGDLNGVGMLSLVLKNETESIINQNRRISSVRRMKPQE